jgi:hypothetical protein
MSNSATATAGELAQPVPKRLAFYERYLTVWVRISGFVFL